METAVKLFAILVLCSVRAIRVPVNWESASEVTHETATQAYHNSEPHVPVEYFQYPAKKPQFAVDVAAYHGVPNPQDHYKAHPVHPYTGREKPVLGQHKILDENNPVFQPFQQYTKINEGTDSTYITPVSSDYEVYHPYKAEEPALQELYKDPVLDKIRNDIRNSQNRLQKYETEAGKPDIKKNEYLESPEQTDRKKFPQRNIPVPYEIHRPQRRPIYYRPTPNYNRDHYLNQKYRHPWNQHNAKIRPVHYRPLKNNIQRLRQHHALTFGDDLHEYPQVPLPEQLSEVPEGYDIYEKGKAKYVALRNNVDESINNAVKENHPTTYQRLELQNNGERTETQISDDDEPEFVPIKNYAQVRKTETTRHLPREEAFRDAASYDEIRNAPRLREAVKSTKAQTVYSEEGYEDAAYDHAGEEKHAAENEGHGGYLKEKEISGGKYKAPSLSEKYQEVDGNEYKEQNLDGKKWKNDDKDKEEEEQEEDYSEDENEESIEKEVYEDVNGDRNKRENESNENESNINESGEESESSQEVNERKKRENTPENITEQHKSSVISKKERNFKVPQINLNTTFLTADELTKSESLKKQPKKDNIRSKYPYYFKNLKNVHKNSPLRYAENLKFIPKKSKGGTEFYDSRSLIKCSEVEDTVDAIPEKFKKDGHPDSDESGETADSEESNTKSKANFDQLKKNQKLGGLGDKIDCFKAKFFGENPLDSPFFKEEIISNPEPITAPILSSYKLSSKKPLRIGHNTTDKFKESSNLNISDLLQKLNSGQKDLQESLIKSNHALRSSLTVPQNLTNLNNAPTSQQTNLNSYIIKSNIQPIIPNEGLVPIQPANTSNNNVDYKSFNTKEDVTQLPPKIREKRATHFIYEPYKIIKDGQIQETKKTTTTSNISPLIKQLQSSGVVDRVTKITESQPVKRNVAIRSYKDIGRKERDKNSKPEYPPEVSFVEVDVDSRRGEPRYEVRVSNHKPKYTPVENKKAMTLEDYKLQTNQTVREPLKNELNILKNDTQKTSLVNNRKFSQITSSARPYFDVNQFLPKQTDIQKTSASNAVKKVIKRPVPTTESSKSIPQETDNYSDEEEEYDEYDEEEFTSTTTTTSTTQKPRFRQRIRTSTTTSKPIEEDDDEEESEVPKLRLVTRFRATPAPFKEIKEETPARRPKPEKYETNSEEDAPKYREKKKKSFKSTLVTDTKRYGEDDDDVKDEIDAKIGVSQDMEEFMPRFENQMKRSHRRKNVGRKLEHDAADEEFDEEEPDYTEENNHKLKCENTKRGCDQSQDKEKIGTEAPALASVDRNSKLRLKPIIHRKKIEIHREIPVDKSSPNITQFKEDIKEIEIIKEMPSKPLPRKKQRIPQKNVEALELYQDENLAKDVNKLGAVEVFRENLDLVTGPKHGGNYRSAQLLKPKEASSRSQSDQDSTLDTAKDADVSQSKNAKFIDSTETLPARRRQALRLSSKIAKPDFSEASEINSKESQESRPSKIQNDERKSDRSAKLIELDEHEEDDDNSRDMHGGNFKAYDNSRSDGRSLHGGNYRNAKVVLSDDDDDESNSESRDDSESESEEEEESDDSREEEEENVEKQDEEDLKSPRIKAAIVLNSFVQSAPHLTTTPGYILDPSKRMYYYVEN